jgi:hypothetical protein
MQYTKKLSPVQILNMQRMDTSIIIIIIIIIITIIICNNQISKFCFNP